MKNMFCFQCEQTAGNIACTGKAGVCGKQDHTAIWQDKLTALLISLAKAVNENKAKDTTLEIMLDGLFTTITNVNFNDKSIEEKTEKVKEEIEKITGAKPSGECIKMTEIWDDNEDIRSLKSLILFGLRGMAAYAYHAYVLGFTDDVVTNFFYEGLAAISKKNSTMDELLPLVMKTGEVNLKCMELLDKANTESYGTPQPTKVPLSIEKGPFIIVSGHDLHDLNLLLEQTKDKGINIYTHGEMLPAHGYPELKKYSHLKGNFGTAWQSQQKEFKNVPAPILFTTNCLMPVKESYKDRVFTTASVSYPEMLHIGQDKDFSPVINKALELGGYKEEKQITGINGGNTVMTGFAHGTVLSMADKVIDAVKSGDIKHFFLVGGCDGAKPGRNYYTEFVKQTPADTIILTLACGKYRFNDLNLGEIGDLPRIMDMGQCNDAYSAIKVALALSEAFECSVNELPLTLVISWYEQKAVCILLSLLHLGIKNILLGPSLPAFISPNVFSYLKENFALTPITSPEDDLKRIIGKDR